jgi:hypothetical protein
MILKPVEKLRSLSFWMIFKRIEISSRYRQVMIVFVIYM